LSRVPVSRLVSQTRIGRTTKIGRREESGDRLTGAVVVQISSRVAPDRGGSWEEETRFLHQIFTHFYWVLNPFGIITWRPRSYLKDYLLVMGLACLTLLLFVRCFLS